MATHLPGSRHTPTTTSLWAGSGLGLEAGKEVFEYTTPALPSPAPPMVLPTAPSQLAAAFALRAPLEVRGPIPPAAEKVREEGSVANVPRAMAHDARGPVSRKEKWSVTRRWEDEQVGTDWNCIQREQEDKGAHGQAHEERTGQQGACCANACKNTNRL